MVFLQAIQCPSKSWERSMSDLPRSVGILDTSTPGQIGTCVRHFGTKTNRHLDNSALQLDKSAPQKDKSALVFFL